ncbi:beta-lactamase family protein [Shewanella insulae]|uniref:serine hydrolase domain-containing protein n=1 Tax=Shewanella insulae TaxID=2681496 RepID=UPI001EFD0945|nr:serine hydrolase domain-containing protein [Shewanella insulae]MCG9739642.1 beta-lactamase family protein [Shewanella insulae]
MMLKNTWERRKSRKDKAEPSAWVSNLVSALLVTSICVAFSGCNSDDKEALNAIDTAKMRQTVAELAEDMLVPGAVVILHTPKGNFEYNFGVSRYGGSEPTRFDQHLRVGSNTKTWVGTIILQMVQEGKLQLGDPVAMHWPGVPSGEQITIAQLLSMESGLHNYTTTLALNQTLDQDPTKAWTQAELLELSFDYPLDFAPGTAFGYSNTNTVLLGLIAQKLDDSTLPEIMRRRLFAPLGMSQTLFPEITDNVLPEPYAHGYMYGTNVLTMDSALPEAMQQEARDGVIMPEDQTHANPSWGWAAGAGISTARELLVWVEALVGGKLLNEEMQKLRLASVKPIDPDNPNTAYYGLGIAKFGQLYGHTGELPGYNSFMGHDPENKVTLVVWTNLAPSVDGRDPATTIAAALINQLYRPVD